jgi:hypothetical protein
MYAIKNVASIDVVQKLQLPYPKHKHWQILTHSDMRIIPKSVLMKWITSKNILYKQHLVPILSHSNVFKKCNNGSVVLFRDPKDTINSYKRLDKSHKIHKLLITNIDDINKEIIMWHEEALVKFSGNKFLHVWFDDLISNQYKTFNLVLEFYGFTQRVNKNFSLPKLRYYRKRG